VEYEINKRIRPLRPKAPEADGTWRMQQDDIDRIQEFASASSASLPGRCHVLRDHDKLDGFIGRAFLIRVAASRCTRSTPTRDPLPQEQAGIGYCNITSAARGLPESITSPTTDHPAEGARVDDFYDPCGASGAGSRGAARRPDRF